MLVGTIIVVGIGLKVTLVRKFFIKQKEKLMWSSVLRTQIQTYFPTALSTFAMIKSLHDNYQTQEISFPTRNLKENYVDPFYEKNVSNFAMVFMKLLILFGLPVFSYCFLKWNRVKIYTVREFDTAYGTLYQNLKNSESIHLVVTIFCMRRMFIAISTIFGNQAIIIDIYLNVFGCLGMIKFFFDFKPMNQAFLNQFEIFNEISLLFIYYFMFLFTDFIPDVEFRYTLGFYFIYLVGSVFFINLVLVIYSMMYAIYFDFMKKRARKKWD